jgi:hypothetical protein
VSNYDPQLALRQTIAGVLDHPSVYMGGPSRQHLRKAEQIIECLRRDPRLMEALRAGMETPPVRMQQINAKFAGRERGDDYGELMPRMSEQETRPEHTAAHDCACRDCVAAETGTVRCKCGYIPPDHGNECPFHTLNRGESP